MTEAETALRSVSESRNVHISCVHVPLNAAGKNARTTGPFFSSSLRVTGVRSWLLSVKSGAFAPTSAATALCSGRVGAFFDDLHLQRHRDLAVQLQRHVVLADRLDRFRQNQLPAIDVESLALQELGDVGSRNRSVQLLGIA